MSRKGIRKSLSACDHRTPLISTSFVLHLHATQQSPTTAKLLLCDPKRLPQHIQSHNTTSLDSIVAIHSRHPTFIAIQTHMERLLRAPANAPTDRAGVLCCGRSRSDVLRSYDYDDQRL